MREVPLGHWSYFLWHLPAGLLLIVALTFAGLIFRSLRHGRYAARELAFRWRVVGWSVLSAAMASGVVWPYLRMAATLTVDRAGAWHFSNYLGVPLATVAASEVREVRGVDLGGLGFGRGRVEVRLTDGSVIESVWLTRDTFDSMWQALGYPHSMVQDSYGDEVIAAHRYGIVGPRR